MSFHEAQNVHLRIEKAGTYIPRTIPLGEALDVFYERARIVRAGPLDETALQQFTATPDEDLASQASFLEYEPYTWQGFRDAICAIVDTQGQYAKRIRADALPEVANHELVVLRDDEQGAHYLEVSVDEAPDSVMPLVAEAIGGVIMPGRVDIRVPVTPETTKFFVHLFDTEQIEAMQRQGAYKYSVPSIRHDCLDDEGIVLDAGEETVCEHHLTAVSLWVRVAKDIASRLGMELKAETGPDLLTVSDVEEISSQLQQYRL